jgi:H2-forming N5,N10-methylenetetrahydromethanopterin dehydrogenase-like enzyme
MRKQISINAYEVEIAPYGGSRVDVRMEVDDYDLSDILGEMNKDDIVRYLEDNGYKVSEED